MSANHSAVVIGAGLGGIATAARLARQGYQVTVLEKNPEPGGRCGKLERDGHRFDTGATLFLMPEIFEETYRALGERMEDHLDLRRIDPTYTIRFDDGYEIALTADLNEMEEQLEAVEPGSFRALLQYLAEGYQNYHKSVKYFVGRNFYNIFSILVPRTSRCFFNSKLWSITILEFAAFSTIPICGQRSRSRICTWA